MNKSLANALASRTAPLRARWDAMPARDRRAVAALSVFFLLLAAWLLVVAPVTGYADRARASLATAREDLAWMQANAARARQAAAAGAGGHLAAGQSLLSAVSTSARDAGLNLQRFEPDGDRRVRVTLENVAFTDAMRWIVDLERRYGLVVEDFGADRQPTPGMANIRLTLGVAP